MNIAVPSALMRSPHDLHGVFDVGPLSGFFGVALVLASLGILGCLSDSLEALLLLTCDRVNLYLSYNVALLMFRHSRTRGDRCLSAARSECRAWFQSGGTGCRSDQCRESDEISPLMHRARPSTRRGALRRSPRSPPQVARSFPAEVVATRSGGPSRAAPYGSPKCSRASRRSSSRPGEVPRFRPQQASAWRGPAIRDHRGTGRQIHRGSERTGTHPRYRLHPDRTLFRGPHPNAAARRLRRISCFREAPCRACRPRSESAAHSSHRGGC